MLSCSSEVILRSVQQMAETLKLIFYEWPNCSERNKTWKFKKQSKSQFCCIPKSRRKRNAVNQKETIKATVKLRALTHLFSKFVFLKNTPKNDNFLNVIYNTFIQCCVSRIMAVTVVEFSGRDTKLERFLKVNFLYQKLSDSF